ncbi:MAG: DAK2 domain-containing protein [Coriobacteriia bacterium]|nr:DAK2 domain-containing protein [Coriobacteriia bacterium]
MIAQTIRFSFGKAAQAVSDRSEEINRLNVFPVPDGDTGTNMALTLGTVVKELDALPSGAGMDKVCAAVIHGSLMGARGNSGVITSQILRGLAESFAEAGDAIETPQVAAAFRRAVKVAFQAVRKPVEGTILTVLRDVSKAADGCEKKKLALADTLDALVAEAFDSVSRTPELLPVLKENGVVDSGAFGFSVFLEAFCDAALGRQGSSSLAESAIARATAKVDIELNDDWEGSEYRYCTEFLFKADAPFDEDMTRDFLATQGDCELLVGAYPDYKIHVHTDHPDHVLGYMLELGQIFKVFIHNMDMEAAERTEKIAEDKAAEPLKELGVVAVAVGDGACDMFIAMGADEVVEGGQTMNPSTADLLQACERAHAKQVIILPNNGNVIMAAQSAASAADFPVGVVPTKSVLQGLSALMEVDRDASLDANVEAMTGVLSGIHDGEVTTAVRNSSAADGTPIHAGDVIGLADGAIQVVGSDVLDVTGRLMKWMMGRFGGDLMTVLTGKDLSSDAFAKLRGDIEDMFPDIDATVADGGQPLYPVVFSIE